MKNSPQDMMKCDDAENFGVRNLLAEHFSTYVGSSQPALDDYGWQDSQLNCAIVVPNDQLNAAHWLYDGV